MCGRTCTPSPPSLLPIRSGQFVYPVRPSDRIEGGPPLSLFHSLLDGDNQGRLVDGY